MLHAANTAGALWLPAARLDLVRVGLGVYGYLPHPAMASVLADAGVARLARRSSRSRRAWSRSATCRKGARPSYGRRRPLERPARVATVPVGYADGYPRAMLDGGAEVLIRGRRRPLAGRGHDGPARSSSATRRSRSATRSCCSGARATRSWTPTSGRARSAPSAGRSCAGSSRESRSSRSSDPGTIAPMGAGNARGAGRAGRDVHGVPPERDEDDGRLRHRVRLERAARRGRGARPRRGPAGRAVRRAVRPAPGPARPRRARAHPGVLLHRERRQVPPARATATPHPTRSPPARPSSRGSSQPSTRGSSSRLGNVATRVLLGTDEGISALRGRTHPWRGRVLVPTFHPAYALRGGGGVVAQMRADLVRAKLALAAPR